MIFRYMAIATVLVLVVLIVYPFIVKFIKQVRKEINLNDVTTEDDLNDDSKI